MGSATQAETAPQELGSTLTTKSCVFTVGYGARPMDEFLEILERASVNLLVDVRRYPGSRRHPHFGREALAAGLFSHGIGYEWWGQSLGGRRKADEVSLVRHRSWQDEAFRAYAAHMDTPEFREALGRLLNLSGDRHVALMCAETLWWRCHRRLIADALLVEGCEVIHLGVGEAQPHRLTDSARVDDNGLLVYDVPPK